VENAKAELSKPFQQEAELAEKSARLTELDTLLSLDGKDEPTADAREGEEVDGDVPAKLKKEEINIAAPPQDKAKKKNHDER